MSSSSRGNVKSYADATKTLSGPVIISGMPAFSESPPKKAVAVNAGRPDLWGFALICVQLALVLLAMYAYEIEGVRGLVALLPLIFGGFIVNALLPLKFRMGFFCLVSAASVVFILGPVNSLRLFAISLLLIGICHLPLPLLARVVLLAAVGGGLAALHVGMVDTEWAAAVLPILAAMFMFRIAIYLYDIRNEKQPAGISARLAYFFMLPNACFPLFPVVDYRTFLRSHYQKDALETYQVGVQWMLRGVIHLLLYRLIYHNLVYSPETVESLRDVTLYMLTTYLLYLRISGLFHLIVGILCLFGFSLPETHHRYYLASSFSDFWRRINIYWKDFMMKMFYYPVFTRVKHLGTLQAMSIATVVVFFGTWILHAYQWFWLRGTFLVTTVDSLFWALLGAMVVVNSIYQAKHPKKSKLGKPQWSWSNAAIHSAKVVGFFTFMTALWAMWSGSSLTEYWSLLRVAAGGTAVEFAGLFGVVALALVVGVVYQYVQHHNWSLFRGQSKPVYLRTPAVTCAGAILLTALAYPDLEQNFGPQGRRMLLSIQDERLNARDEQILERGYYEGLLAAGNWGSQVWERRVQEPLGWGLFRKSDAVYEMEGITHYALKPSYESVHSDVTIRTNQWGMRDKEYTKAKPAGVYRIALLGASYEMGQAIEQDKVYEAVAEDIINQALVEAGDDRRVEILNFSVSGYGLIQWVEQAQDIIWEFDPDAVFLTARVADKYRSTRFLARAVQNRHPLPPALEDIARRAQLEPGMSESELQRRINRLPETGDTFGIQFYEWGYREIGKACEERGVKGIWVFVPRTEEAVDGWTKEQQQLVAEDAGLMAFDLDGAYGERKVVDLQVAPWDRHPNAEAHHMLGARLAELVLENRAMLGY